MSDESKQLSVAELLARNGQQGASSSGGGRRRRGGRGISVAELTGDLPVIREGGSHSAHAAPDDEIAEAPSAYEPASYAPTSFEPTAFEPPSYEPAAYEPAAFEPVASEPVSYIAPDPVADLPSQSPMSGPITRYDPLAPYRESTSYPEPTPYPATPSYSDPPPGRSNLVMPGRDMSSGSRHSAPDPLESAAPYADPVSEAPRSSRGGRRRKPDPDDDATIVVGPPLRDPMDFDIPRNGHPDEPRGSDRQERGRGGRAARRRAAEADEAGPSTAAWAPPSNGFAPDSAPLPLSPLPERAKPSGRAANQEPREEQRRSSRSETLRARAEGALPSWSARRHKPEPEKSDSEPESGGIPTAAWSLASQDQQLVSGSTVAGDLLRDGVERAERAGGGRGRSRGGRAQVELDEGLTDVHDSFLLDDDEDEDEAPEPRQKPAARPTQRRSRAARKAEYDANRKQWMILGGQSAGAAVAGMLLFKGFERMWEMLPWVALALAMIVILGLVALVRILRRTDDILSTVIAVVVGIFVTLGPLAFLLSTN